MARSNPALPFLRNAEAQPARAALDLSSAAFSYQQLRDRAGQVAGWMRANVETRTRRIAVLASRSLEGYCGVLGAAWLGSAYVPINPAWPAGRAKEIIAVAKPDAVVADAAGVALMAQAAPGEFSIPTFGPDDWKDSLTPPDPAEVSPRDIAYIIFTSGTTGIPKGVLVSYASLNAFLDGMRSRYEVSSEDRFSQASELTFDVSVFDMFMAWDVGASLHIVPRTKLMAPRDFIRDKGITVWFSVPSIALIMQKMRMLAPGVFPTLRYSLFAGEALPSATALAWQVSAPNSSVENLYGPTEATVVCLGCKFRGAADVTPDRGIVTTGRELAGIAAQILDSDLRPAADGVHGQLAISGEQLAEGYLDDPLLTERRFPTLDGRRWYLTGDLAYRDQRGVFHHLGRIDNQVKLHGHRVEIEEVESHVRACANTDSAVAIPVGASSGSAEKLIAFVSGCAIPLLELHDALKRRLPSYMVPEIRLVERLPLGPSGKFDRKTLLIWAEQEP